VKAAKAENEAALIASAAGPDNDDFARRTPRYAKPTSASKGKKNTKAAPKTVCHSELPA
jgi:hypothetical protein